MHAVLVQAEAQRVASRQTKWGSHVKDVIPLRPSHVDNHIWKCRSLERLFMLQEAPLIPDPHNTFSQGRLLSQLGTEGKDFQPGGEVTYLILAQGDDKR